DMNSDENDGMDETWCLFDGQLVDDEIANLWSLFPQNVRILVISDSCHSGTITKSIRNNIINPSENHRKFMPGEIAVTTYYSNKSFYDGILAENKIIKAIEASVKLISGCQDNQFSYDGTFNGAFTGILKSVWNGGRFDGNYNSFHKQIMNLLPPKQTPNHYNTGNLNVEFDNEKPFTI
ncbi:MAG: caspase family protein, partial [Bacteroidales bacterium]|nr:caspase family protein [Bacteroidales bacterium]